MIMAFGEGTQFAKVGAIGAVIIILTCTPWSYLWWVSLDPHRAIPENPDRAIPENPDSCTSCTYEILYTGIVFILHAFLLFSGAGLGWLLGADWMAAWCRP